jgi:hypothetical protein
MGWMCSAYRGAIYIYCRWKSLDIIQSLTSTLTVHHETHHKQQTTKPTTRNTTTINKINHNETTRSETRKPIQPVHRRICNTSECNFTSVFSDCPTTQHNTSDILRSVIEICNRDKKLEQLENTQIYRHRTKWTHNLD